MMTTRRFMVIMFALVILAAGITLKEIRMNSDSLVLPSPGSGVGCTTTILQAWFRI